MMQETNKGIIIKCKIIPNASRSEIVGWEESELKIRIAAQPDKGEANKELIRFLSKLFSIGKSNIVLTHGLTSRHKIICINGISLKDAQEKITN